MYCIILRGWGRFSFLSQRSNSTNHSKRGVSIRQTERHNVPLLLVLHLPLRTLSLYIYVHLYIYKERKREMVIGRKNKRSDSITSRISNNKTFTPSTCPTFIQPATSLFWHRHIFDSLCLFFSGYRARDAVATLITPQTQSKEAQRWVSGCNTNDGVGVLSVLWCDAMAP